MAALIVREWNTFCSQCGMQTLWTEGGHEIVSGVAENEGMIGCGAKWDSIVLPRYLPLLPDWMKKLNVI